MGRQSRTPFFVSTIGRSISIGFATIASSKSPSDSFGSESPSSAYSGSFFRIASRTGIPAALISALSFVFEGGAFRYSTTFGSMPASRSSSSVLREVLQRGLW